MNPCGFALLPAFLSFYVGAEERHLPRATTRLAQGIKPGLLVTAGFLLTFAVVGLPMTYGARQIVGWVPWAGIALGVVLAAGGLALVAGRRLSVTVANPIRTGGERGPVAMVAFGVGYGIASLGCTLPVFLAVVGASLATEGAATALGVLGAYGIGMAVVLITLSVATALVRDGLAHALRRLARHLPRIAGALMVVAGAYLTYYWARVRFGSAATLSHDPIVGFVGQFAGSIERFAAGGGRIVIYAAALVVAIVGAVAARQWWRAPQTGVPSARQ